MKTNLLYNLATIIALFSILQPVASTHHKSNPADDRGIEPCSIENQTFQGGEEIVYKLYYNWNFVWMTAGEVTFRVKEVGNQYQFSVIGASYKSYDWFFPVNDRYDTYVDKETLLPSVSVKTIEEGDYRLYDKTILNQRAKKAEVLRGKTKDTAKQHYIDIDGCMHDMVSILYYTRNINFEDFKPGQRFPVKIFMDTKTYPLSVKYIGKEANKAVKGAGKYNTIAFSPEVVAGKVFKENAQMKVWATDDNNKIPVLIESPLSVGSVKAVLKSYRGLKYDLTAKVE
jgi:hypothetical protein